MATLKRSKQPRRRVIVNHDGGVTELSHRVPADWDTVAQQAVGALAGTHVDTLFWHIGSHTFFHDTKVGELRSDGIVDSVGEWRRAENCRRMIAEGRDILARIIDAGHHAGLEVFATLRMNDIHDSLYVNRMGKFKTQHPEYLLGDSVRELEGNRPWKFSPRTCLDYAIPQVRAMKLDVIEETLERYDVDGFELDWTRHPWAFRPGHELFNVGVMTEFTREIRRHIDAASTRKGQPLYLALAIPGTFDHCLQIGLDVCTWLKEGLIDILIVGGPAFAMSLKETRQRTRDVGCQLFSRLIQNPVLKTPENVRAAASTHYMDGADGIYLFNYYNRPHRAQINEIGDPKMLKRLDKHYIVSQRPDPTSRVVHTVVRPIPSTAEPLPVNLVPSSTGQGQIVPLKVADDIEAAAEDDALAELKLMVKLENFCREEDAVQFEVNGERLEKVEIQDQIAPGTQWFHFSMDGPPLKRGDNEIKVILERRNPSIKGMVVLSEVELVIRYR